jgi:hypothetical protein
MIQISTSKKHRRGKDEGRGSKEGSRYIYPHQIKRKVTPKRGKDEPDLKLLMNRGLKSHKKS